ncbi:permease-like cell division protein FtsX [Angustibacter sp. McL0619]|uniref:permease-like cell division protein FtsX n=1 Tax=Angustibacter sp. McL0619 TaxID=3415676 RepID=UPI003CF6F3E1
MRLQFVLSEMAIGLRRNLSMTVSLVLVTMVSLVFFGFGLLSSMQVNEMKDFWYGKVEVWIALCPARSLEPSCASGEVTQAQKDEMSQQLDSLKPLVSTVYFESKQEAYDHFVQQFKDSAIKDSVKPDQMQESFRVKLSDPKKYDVVASAFEGAPGVERVIDQRKLLSTMFFALNRVTIGAWIFAGAMTLSAILLVATTVRLSAFNRRREIGIMRLVGASNLFIQLPFLMEAILATVLGAGIAIGTLWALTHFAVQGWLAQKMQFIPFVTGADVLSIAPVVFGIGLLIAVLTSFLTMRRYLRV